MPESGGQLAGAGYTKVKGNIKTRGQKCIIPYTCYDVVHYQTQANRNILILVLFGNVRLKRPAQQKRGLGGSAHDIHGPPRKGGFRFWTMF